MPLDEYTPDDEPLKWLDPKHPTLTDDKTYIAMTTHFTEQLLAHSPTAKWIAQSQWWEGWSNIGLTLHTNGPHYWNFHGTITCKIDDVSTSMNKREPGSCWDLGDDRVETVRTADITDVLLSNVLVSLIAKERRSLLQPYFALERRNMVAEAEEDRIEEIEQGLRNAYECSMRGIVHSAYEPETAAKRHKRKK